ncbi:MAG TPA: secondary thiamine-phosphate synthase enzyme YjbQ [Gaiellaceae bacterium]|nr:secondary thiamine-phosphate synthase enzyme YjbQ [Gaiellaceae bacterium]
MSFFEPPPPELPPQPPRRPWHGPPDNVAGRSVALDLVLGRSERAAIWIASANVYPDGFEFEVEIRRRFDEGEIEHPFFMHHPRRRRRHGEDELDPELVRFGIEFSDGGKATNLGRHPPFTLPGEPDEPPEGPVLSPSRGGGGGGGRWHHGFWAWPLPPEGPLAFVSEWPVADIAETRTEIDSALIRAAAADVVELWPQDDRAAGGGGQHMMLQRVRGEPRPRQARPWHELTIESGQKTQLIDVTDRVRALVSTDSGAAAVLFVPHTTAGIVLQASGAGATKVAADIETALERLIDVEWPWQHLDEGDRNPSSHARAALTASSITVPLERGELAIGDLQRIFFCEFDGPRTRHLRVRTID